LAGIEGIRHGFFGRQGGTSTGIFASLNCGPGSSDDPERVAQNRARVAEHLEVQPANLVSLYQIHSATPVTVNQPWDRASPPQADGMVTDRPGIALGILSADCGPVLFCDPEAQVIGAAHAGWQGALSGILEATLKAMEDLGADRSRIHATLGPTISQNSYQVGPEFKEKFTHKNNDFHSYFKLSDKDHHFQFDLPSFIQNRLKEAGIQSATDLARCTYEDADGLFSYRRTTHRGEADYGRNISVITLSGAR
jgi:YfiH family protein